MAYVIEITEDKVSSLAENAEKMLRYGGKLMQCIDELQRESERSEMGERNNGGYGNRYGNRYWMRDDNPDDMGERRGVSGSGRWGRY